MQGRRQVIAEDVQRLIPPVWNHRVLPRLRERSARYLTRMYRRCFHDGFTRTGKIILLASVLIFLFSYQTNSDFLLASAAVGIAPPVRRKLVWCITNDGDPDQNHRG